MRKICGILSKFEVRREKLLLRKQKSMRRREKINARETTETASRMEKSCHCADKTKVGSFSYVIKRYRAGTEFIDRFQFFVPAIEENFGEVPNDFRATAKETWTASKDFWATPKSCRNPPKVFFKVWKEFWAVQGDFCPSPKKYRMAANSSQHSYTLTVTVNPQSR